MKTKCVTRISDNGYFKGLLQEAKRVGYVATKDADITTVTDPTNDNAMVFQGIKMNRKHVLIRYSEVYFQAPEHNLAYKAA